MKQNITVYFAKEELKKTSLTSISLSSLSRPFKLYQRAGMLNETGVDTQTH